MARVYAVSQVNRLPSWARVGSRRPAESSRKASAVTVAPAPGRDRFIGCGARIVWPDTNFSPTRLFGLIQPHLPSAIWLNHAPAAPPSSLSGRVAMQKVEGSSPFVRFEEPAGNGRFLWFLVFSHVAEPRRSAEGDAVRPLQFFEARDRLVLDLRAMPAPVLVLGDDQLRGELLDVADAHLSPVASCSLGERVREAVNVAGRAVVDDGDSGRSRHRFASTSSGAALKSIRRWLPSRQGCAPTRRSGREQPT
jgi:hypothetical protein